MTGPAAGREQGTQQQLPAEQDRVTLMRFAVTVLADGAELDPRLRDWAQTWLTEAADREQRLIEDTPAAFAIRVDPEPGEEAWAATELARVVLGLPVDM